MPMDIRSFFKKKEPKKKPSSAAAKSSPQPGGAENETNQILMDEDRTPVTKPAAKKNDKILIDEDRTPVAKSAAKKDEKKTTPKSASPVKRRRTKVESDDEDYLEILKSPTSKSPARAKKAGDGKVEITASDFFAKSASKKPAVMTNVGSPNRKKTAASSAPPPPETSPAKKVKTEQQSRVESPAKKLKTEASAASPARQTKESSPPAATSPAKKAKAEPPAPSPAKKVKESPQPPSSQESPTKKAKKSSSPKKEKVLAPENVEPLPTLPATAPECLLGYTFCITAVDPHWSRDDATDFLKGRGARVTTAVSGKTDYLVVLGERLEDNRFYTEGSKYKTAMEKGARVIVGRELLNGVVKFHSDAKGGAPPPDPPKSAPAAPSGKVIKNPYARKNVTNPYAKKPVPPKNTTTTAKATASPAKSAAPPPGGRHMLWVDKYKPKSSREILGNQESVRKLRVWLDRWESEFNKDKLVGKAFSNPKGPWKAVLLSGPPGIGKTTTATLVAQESGRHVLEFNASDVRSKKSLKEDVGDITGSRTLNFGKQTQTATKRVIIMDEVDGLGAGDRGGLAELIQMIKGSRVPIICICNDRQSQKIKSLVPYCMDLRYRRPVKSQIATRIVEVARQEGFVVEINAAEMLAESCGNDVRQCLNACQMWASENEGKRMSYTNLKEREKSINKDEMLRVNLFDATRLILQGRNGLQGATPETERAHFLKRNDAFFVDYNFTGLMVQQNYLNILNGPHSKAVAAKKMDEVQDILNRMSLAAEATSDFALAEHKLRSDQNWSVLPFVGSLTVKTGYHAGGESGGFLSGFPEFTTWLGKNSSKGKKTRMMQDLQHHMNFRISGGSEEMRLSYLPVLRARFLSMLQDKNADRTDEIIELMDKYGLDRDDIMERLDEFKMDKKDKGFSVLDSKQKAALTRAYTAVGHKSQALVVEQGGVKKSKRKAASEDELGDPDVVDDDKKEDDEEEEELDEKAVAALFKKNGRKSAAKKTGAKKTAPKPKKK